MEVSEVFSDAMEFKMTSLLNLYEFILQGFVVFFQVVDVVICSLFLFAPFGSNLLDFSVSFVDCISESDILSFGFFQRVDMSSFECLKFFKIICFQLASENIDFFVVIGFVVAELSLQLFLFILQSQYLIVCLGGQPLEFVYVVIDISFFFLELLLELPNLMLRRWFYLVDLSFQSLRFHLLVASQFTNLVVLLEFKFTHGIFESIELSHQFWPFNVELMGKAHLLSR